MHEPLFDTPDPESITEELLPQINESLALTQRGMEQHWSSYMAKLAELCGAGGLPEDLTKALVEFTEHCIEETVQAQWTMAKGVMAQALWSEGYPNGGLDPAEVSRRRSVNGVAVVKAKSKIARAKTDEDVRKIISEWSFAHQFESMDEWDWEGDGSRTKTTVPARIQKLLSEAVGMDIDFSTLKEGEPMVAEVTIGEDGKPRMKAVSKEQFERETGKNFEQFIKEKNATEIVATQDSMGRTTSEVVNGKNELTEFKDRLTEAIEHAKKKAEEQVSRPTLKDILPGLNWKKDKE